MSYQDRWQTAAFRTLEFLTDSHDAKGGRRLAVHEFPGAEQPLVEDLGGQAWDWSLNAYFIGADYDTECDTLIAELNKPGADWLIHPWLGRLWVRARGWSRRESNNEQGFCTLVIEFVPGGEQPATPTQDKTDTAQAAIDGLADAAEADFDLLAMGEEALTAFNTAVSAGMSIIDQAISLSALPLTYAQRLLRGSAAFKTALTTLAAVPGQYANAFRSLTNSMGLGADEDGLPATDRPRWVSRLSALAVSKAQPVLLTPSGTVIIDPVVRSNLQRESVLQSRLLLSAALQVALVDYATEADRDQALRAVDAAVDTLLPALPDLVFQAAVSARTALIEAVMAQDLKPQQIRDVVQPLPSTVLAHRMQIDEAVLIARNGVRHPLFVRGRVYG